MSQFGYPYGFMPGGFIPPNLASNPANFGQWDAMIASHMAGPPPAFPPPMQPFDALPVPGGFFGQAAFAMLAEPYIRQTMTSSGMYPGGFNNVNPYDSYVRNKFHEDRMRFLAQAAKADAPQIQKQLVGFQRMLGMEVNAQTNQNVSNALAKVLPYAPMFEGAFPNIMGTIDKAMGPRGSAMVLAENMMLGNLYQGSAAGGPEAAARLAERMYNTSFNQDPMNIYGIRDMRAGEFGQLYADLAQRGALPVAPMSTSRKVEDAWANLQQRQPRVAASIAARHGIADPNKLSTQDIERLRTVSAVQDEVLNVDTERITKGLGNQIRLVNAMKDIFGDAGKPNAPMRELVAALDALTSGAFNAPDAAKTEQSLRTMYNLTRQTGGDLNSLALLHGRSQAMATDAGLNPTLTPGVTTQGLLYGNAFNMLNIGQHVIPGGLTKDQLQYGAQRGYIGAAQSHMANTLGFVRRIANMAGIDSFSAEGREFIEAVESGATTFGNNQSVASMDRSSIIKLLLQSNPNLSARDLEMMAGQTDANALYVTDPIARLVRSEGQGAEFRNELNMAGQSAFGASLRSRRVTGADGLSRVFGRAFGSAFAGMDVGLMAAGKESDRREYLTDQVLQSLQKDKGYNALLSSFGGDEESLRQAVSSSVETSIGQAQRVFAHRGTTLAAQFQLNSTQIQDAARVSRAEAEIEAGIQSRLSGMGSSGAVSGLFAALGDVKGPLVSGGKLTEEGQAFLPKILGGVSYDTMREELRTPATAIASRLQTVQKLISDAENIKDPAHRARTLENLDKEAAALYKSLDNIKPLIGGSLKSARRSLRSSDFNEELYRGLDSEANLPEHVRGMSNAQRSVWLQSKEGRDYLKQKITESDAVMNVLAMAEGDEKFLSSLSDAEREELAEARAITDEIQALADRNAGGDVKRLKLGNITLTTEDHADDPEVTTEKIHQRYEVLQEKQRWKFERIREMIERREKGEVGAYSGVRGKFNKDEEITLARGHHVNERFQTDLQKEENKRGRPLTPNELAKFRQDWTKRNPDLAKDFNAASALAKSKGLSSAEWRKLGKTIADEHEKSKDAPAKQSKAERVAEILGQDVETVKNLMASPDGAAQVDKLLSLQSSADAEISATLTNLYGDEAKTNKKLREEFDAQVAVEFSAAAEKGSNDEADLDIRRASTELGISHKAGGVIAERERLKSKLNAEIAKKSEEEAAAKGKDGKGTMEVSGILTLLGLDQVQWKGSVSGAPPAGPQ